MSLKLSRSWVGAHSFAVAFSAMTDQVWENKQSEQWVIAHQPFRGIGNPQDVANAALFLASEENTWMTGACMSVDGGFAAM